ncbi:cytochrome-c peroxidase [Lentibacter sp. XHP0401]|uniref:cytochrome-c peroxidase n=1 Tax=Lentibacter sp. XHP0401 TaxID=2984334 RepID=UPI0021E811F5|nr:cytochrome c peroxidase [Lentibacter sp. XHP0401]MCV2892299.1 cytochrome-c peroxidase [Lentibacter sp. XHP0401]
MAQPSKDRLPRVAKFLKWVTVGLLSLQANLSLAADTLSPVTHSDFPRFPDEQVLLGRDLFFDPLLSGNRNISCASCHHGVLGSADAVPLSVGEGGTGLGKRRRGSGDAPAERHIPRNAPAIFNLGATEFTTLFHDGRVSVDSDAPFGILMPEGHALERGVVNILGAQALLPILSHEEMAGANGENEIGSDVFAGRIRGPNGAWAKLAARIEAIPAYRRRFTALNGNSEPLHITDIGNAIGAFLAQEFRADNSPFDAYLRGDKSALTAPQARGMELFYGKSTCSSCHAGRFQTDHGFHAIGIPQIGPGKDHGKENGVTRADFGRSAITGIDKDKYCFRTPSLRNVALTAPYGHSGAYASLEAVVRHHLAPRESLMRFDPSKAPVPALSGYGTVTPQMPDAEELARIAAAITLDIPPLTDAEVNDIISFLHALTDRSSIGGKLGAPASVPSGLKVDSILD